MQRILSVYKPISKTPLEIIQAVKSKYPELSNVPISYVGRLDPMAHGVLVLLAGEAIQKREAYLHLQKSYTFEVIYGVSTDTYDMLGLVNKQKYIEPVKNVNLFANSFVKKHIGTWMQEYPPFSSKTVHGKPLFWWAKNDLLNTVIIPKHEITIKTFTIESHGVIQTDRLHQRINEQIKKVKGDFRQKEILAAWELFFKKAPKQLMTTRFSFSCSSGTYVRGLVHKLGADLGCGAIAIDILRTRVGEYALKDTIKIMP